MDDGTVMCIGKAEDLVEHLDVDTFQPIVSARALTR